MEEVTKNIDSAINQTTGNFMASNNMNSILQYRLSTEGIIRQMQEFLEGKITDRYIDERTGKMVIQELVKGEAKANSLGIQGILSLLGNLMGPHTVQGNFKEDSYYNFIDRLHARCTEIIMTNLHVWGIDPHDFSLIMCEIIDVLEVFFTRTIDNKERESYIPTIKTVETSNVNQTQKSDGGFQLFGGKG